MLSLDTIERMIGEGKVAVKIVNPGTESIDYEFGIVWVES